MSLIKVSEQMGIFRRELARDSDNDGRQVWGETKPKQGSENENWRIHLRWEQHEVPRNSLHKVGFMIKSIFSKISLKQVNCQMWRQGKKILAIGKNKKYKASKSEQNK